MQKMSSKNLTAGVFLFCFLVLELWLFPAAPWVGLQCVIVEFSYHTKSTFCAKLLQAVSANERTLLKGVKHMICDVILRHCIRSHIAVCIHFDDTIFVRSASIQARFFYMLIYGNFFQT